MNELKVFDNDSNHSRWWPMQIKDEDRGPPTDITTKCTPTQHKKEADSYEWFIISDGTAVTTAPPPHKKSTNQQRSRGAEARGTLWLSSKKNQTHRHGEATLF